MIGKRLGILTVLGPAKTKNKRSGFRVRCDCGEERVMTASNLRVARSCGCLRAAACRRNGEHGVNSRFLGPGVGLMNRTLRAAVKGAAERGLAFELGYEAFAELVLARCHFCGAEPSQRKDGGYRRPRPPLVVNGIDRLDSARGYVPGNVVTACWRCNRAKGADSVQDFLAWAARLGERAAALRREHAMTDGLE